MTNQVSFKEVSPKCQLTQPKTNKEANIKNWRVRSASLNPCDSSPIELLLGAGKSQSLMKTALEEWKPNSRSESLESNLFSLFVCMLSGLYCLMHVQSVVRVLKNTRNSDSGSRAFERYLDTINHVLKWTRDENQAQISLRKVHKMHLAASKLAVRRLGVTISQFDLVVTQWAFVGPALIAPRNFGLSPKCCTSLAEFIGNVGNSLGVAKELNLCRPEGIQATIQYAKDIHKRIIQPCLKAKPTTETTGMTTHLMAGVELINPFIRPQVFALRVRQVLLPSDHPRHDQLRLVLSERLLLRLQEWILDKGFHLPFGFGLFLRTVMNALLRLNIWLANILRARIVRRNSDKMTNETPNWASRSTTTATG